LDTGGSSWGSRRRSREHIRHVVIAPISLTEAHLSKGSLVLILGDSDTARGVPAADGKVSVRELIRKCLLTGVSGNQLRLLTIGEGPLLEDPTAF